MPSEPDDFDALYEYANKVRRASLYSDAFRIYQRALAAPGGSTWKRLWAKFMTGECCRLLGRTSEAIAVYAELYLECLNRPEHYEIAFRALCSQLNTAVIERTRSASAGETKNLLKLVDDSLRWLQDIGKENWQPSLLLVKSKILADLKDLDGALDISEEAYRKAKSSGSGGFVLGYYPTLVAWYACRLGRYARALEVLAEMTNRTMIPGEHLDVLIGTTRALMGSGRILEALETARQSVHIADQLQTPWEKMLAYGNLAECSAKTGSWIEANHALEVLAHIALDDRTVSQESLLREVNSYLGRVAWALRPSDDPAVSQANRFRRVKNYLGRIFRVFRAERAAEVQELPRVTEAQELRTAIDAWKKHVEDALKSQPMCKSATR